MVILSFRTPEVNEMSHMMGSGETFRVERCSCSLEAAEASCAIFLSNDLE